MSSLGGVDLSEFSKDDIIREVRQQIAIANTQEMLLVRMNVPSLTSLTFRL